MRHCTESCYGRHRHCSCHSHHGWLRSCASFLHGRHHHGLSADVTIDAVAGECRIVAYEIVNDSHCDLTVEPEIGPIRDVCSGDVVATPGVVEIAPSAAVPLAPCERTSFRIRVNTEHLSACATYETEIRFKGTCCVATLQIRLEPPAAVICRHDISHVRAWLKQCCFGREPTKVWAPAPVRSAGCGCC